MIINVNDTDVELTDEECLDFSSGKIPKKIENLGRKEDRKVYKTDGTFEEKECLVYNIHGKGFILWET